jgi:hypothetical protein
LARVVAHFLRLQGTRFSSDHVWQSQSIPWSPSATGMARKLLCQGQGAMLPKSALCLLGPLKRSIPQPIRSHAPSFPLLTFSASQQLSTPFVTFGTQPYALLNTAHQRSIRSIFWIRRFALLRNAGLVDLSSPDTIS